MHLIDVHLLKTHENEKLSLVAVVVYMYKRTGLTDINKKKKQQLSIAALLKRNMLNFLSVCVQCA